MWRASAKLRCLCRIQTRTQRCGLCTPAGPTKESAAAAAAAKGSQPPLTKPPPEQPSSSPPPPSGGSGGGIFFKLLGLSLVGAGGVVGYAWYDAKFKKQLEENIPGAKMVLDAVLPLLPASPDQAIAVANPAILKKEDKALPADKGLARVIKVPDPVPEKAEEKKVKQVEKKKEDDKKKAATLKKEEEEKKKTEAKVAKKEKEDAVQRIVREKEAEEAAENADLSKFVPALEDILSEFAANAVNTCQIAISSLNTATDATRKHGAMLQKAMDESLEGEKKEAQWKSLSKAHDERVRAEHKLDGVILDAKESLEKLKSAIKEGRSNKITRKNIKLDEADESYALSSFELSKAESENQLAKQKSKGMDSYRDLIKKGREEFRKELESIKPEVRIGRRVGGKMTEEELNALIAHAHRRIEQLQKQIAEFQAMEGVRLGEALQKKEEEDEVFAREQIARESKHLMNQFELEKRRLELNAEANCEREIRQQLTRQAAAHSDHLAQVVSLQKEELQKKYEQLLHDEVITEKDNLRKEIAGWVARLRGIEVAIEGRAEMERIGRKAQELWLACQSLVSVIQTGREDVETWEEGLLPLGDEVKAITEAGNNHPFVNTVVQSIPQEALDRGVWTKDALIERFETVQRVCRRVAMIDDSGATLYRYFVSYLQSLLVFNQKALGPNDDIDPSTITPFMLIYNARHCLEHGDLEQAVKYVNQLEGEPRRVAEDWLHEARLLLETKQAADALLSHASAAGLGALF